MEYESTKYIIWINDPFHLHLPFCDLDDLQDLGIFVAKYFCDIEARYCMMWQSFMHLPIWDPACQIDDVMCWYQYNIWQ